MTKFILLLFILITNTAQAFSNQTKADPELILGMFSHHWQYKSHKYLNEENPSIGLKIYDIQAIYVHKNSWDKKSIYLMYSPDFYQNNSFVFSGNLGLASGYKESNYVEYINDDGEKDRYYNDKFGSKSGIVPIVGVTGQYKVSQDTGINLTVTPLFAILSFSIKI